MRSGGPWAPWLLAAGRFCGGDFGVDHPDWPSAVKQHVYRRKIQSQNEVAPNYLLGMRPVSAEKCLATMKST